MTNTSTESWEYAAWLLLLASISSVVLSLLGAVGQWIRPVATALCVAGVALPMAFHDPEEEYDRTPSWVEPVALALGLVGIIGYLTAPWLPVPYWVGIGFSLQNFAFAIILDTAGEEAATRTWLDHDTDADPTTTEVES